MPALLYANDTFGSSIKWLMHADDDTYVVLSALVKFLKKVRNQLSRLLVSGTEIYTISTSLTQ